MLKTMRHRPLSNRKVASNGTIYANRNGRRFLMFNKKSAVARIWADTVKKGDKKLEEVPDLSNLIAVVTSIVEKVEINV